MKRKELELKDVAHIGELAYLSIKEEDLPKFTEQLNEILSFFERLQEINTDEVPPLSQVVPLEGELREDQINASLPSSAWQAVAPRKRGGFFIVPPIFAEE